MRHLLAIAALAPLFAIPALTAPAAAADLAPAAVPYYKAPPAVVMGWTGGYVGISAGGRWADTTWTTSSITLPAGPPDPTHSPSSFDSSSARVGGYFGYNWQITPQWVIGAEADFAWGHDSKTMGGIPGTFGTGGQANGPAAATVDSSNVTLNWDGSVRGRLGFLVAPNWLVYGTGGLAFQEVDLNASCSGAFISWCITARNETASTTQLGWTVGGGIETQLWRNWLLRAEYRYADYGNIGHTFFAGTIDQVVMQESVRTHTALVGLAYKFGN